MYAKLSDEVNDLDTSWQQELRKILYIVHLVNAVRVLISCKSPQRGASELSYVAAILMYFIDYFFTSVTSPNFPLWCLDNYVISEVKTFLNVFETLLSLGK